MPSQALVRAPRADEMDLVYAMGFDVWADGATFEQYLSDCRTSKKYAAGQWRVLEHVVHGLIASLLIQPFDERTFGLGSVATLPALRKQGAATRLIKTVLLEIDDLCRESLIYLYSDVDAGFYRRFEFTPLGGGQQKYKTTTCMVRSTRPAFAIEALTAAEIPSYF